MWNFTTSLLERFAGLSPLKSFLKYIFHRLSKDYLDRQPTIDFRNGVLDLEDLPLSATKINKGLLCSSPYSMHSGSIRSLRIVLPSLSELSAKSIEVHISDVQVCLRPNKQFESNFTERVAQLKEEQKYSPEEPETRPLVDSDNSIDFFKQLLKQILTNIKVRVTNVCVQVFMNTPSEGTAKPQYYSMMRIPTLIFERFNDMEIGKQSEEFEKYRLQVPQISAHLLREDMKLPEYANLQSTQKDFPWQYPPVNHPSTIMLVGSDDPRINPAKISLVLRISKDVKHKSKEISIRIDLPNIEFMVEGYQLQVLLKYMAQLKEFKVVYRQAMDRIRMQERQQENLIEESRELEVPVLTTGGSRKSIRNPSGGIDIFASVVIAFQDDGTEKRHSGKRKADFIDSIMLENDSEAQNLKREVLSFNKEAPAELKEKMLREGQVQYKSNFAVRAEVALVRVYLLKWNAFTFTEYERCWTRSVNKKFLSLNQNVPCSYFQATLKSLALQMDGPSHITASLRKAEIKNIKLFSSPKEEEVVFHDPINQSTRGFDVRGLSDSPKDKPKNIKRELVRFEPQHGDHYCSSSILSISATNQSRTHKGGCHKKYNLMASNGPNERVDNCLTMRFTKDKKEMKVSLMVGYVSAFLDLEAGRDLVNILYPMFIYRHLVEVINLKRQQPAQNGKNHISIYFSNYDMTGISRDAQHSVEKHSSPLHHKTSEVKKILTVELRSLRVAVMDSPAKLFENLVEKEQRKTEDWQSYENTCFCGHSGETVGLEVRQVKCLILKKSTNVKVRDIFAGFYSLSSTRHSNFTPLVVLSQKENHPIELFYEKVCTEGIRVKHFLGLFIPRCQLSVPGIDQPRQFVDYLHHHFTNSLLLKHYCDTLKDQMAMLETGRHPTSKEENLNKVPLVFWMDIQNANIYYASFGVFARHLIMEFESDRIAVKINDALVIGLENRRVVLRSSNLTEISQQSYDPEGYSIERFCAYASKISSDRIIMWLAAATSFNSPNVEAHDRSYYLWLQKQFYALEIVTTKSAVERPALSKATEIKQSETFCFTKPKRAEKSKEKQEHLSTELKLKVPVGVRSCELLDLPSLLKDLMFLKDHTDSIQRELKALRRTNRPREQEVRTKKLTFAMRADSLALDSFPYFERTGSHCQLSNSRSVLNLHDFYLEFCKVETYSEGSKTSEVTNFHCQAKEFAGSLLVFHDNHPENNPITLPVDHLDDYGFKRLLMLKAVSFDMQMLKRQGNKKLELAINVEDAEYSSAASTTVYLQNHISDLLQNLPKQRSSVGLPENGRKPAIQMHEISSDCQLSDEDDEGPAENINEIDTRLEQQKRQRTEEELELRRRQIAIIERPNLARDIHVKMIGVKSLGLTIYSGDDFAFLKTNPCKVRYRDEAVSIELAEDNSIMSVTALDIQKVEESRVRFRSKEADWHTFLKAEVKGIEFQLLKQLSKTQPNSEALQCKLKLESVLSYFSQLEEDRFVVLRIEQEVLLGVEKSHRKIKVKTSPLPKVHIGFNSCLKFITKERTQVKDQIASSFFARKPAKRENHSTRLQVANDLLLYVPEFTLVLNVKLIGLKILSQLEIKVGELFFHNLLSKYLEGDNKAFVRKWIGDMIKGNIGSVLGNSLVMLLSEGAWLLLTGLKHLVGLPGELVRSLIR